MTDTQVVTEDASHLLELAASNQHSPGLSLTHGIRRSRRCAFQIEIEMEIKLTIKIEIEIAIAG